MSSDSIETPVQRTVRVAARALARAGLVHAYGHCSQRLDASTFLVCAALPLGLIRPSDPGTVVSINDPLPDGVLGEVRIHQQIYRHYPGIGGVCRTMPPHAMTLAALGRVPAIRHGFGCYFADGFAYWNDPQLLRSDDQAKNLVARMDGCRAILMRGNGLVVAGKNVEQAVVLTWYAEDAARIELEALRCSEVESGPLISIEEARLRATSSGRIFERMWEYLTAGDPEGEGSGPDSI